MDWEHLTRHTLLRLAFLILLFGLGMRILFFLFAVIKFSLRQQFRWRHLCANLGRAMVPLHMAVPKKPLSTLLRYIFHTGIVVVPIWYSGHVYLWEEYGFNWYWTPLPDVWSDRLTLTVLILSGCFFIRRIIIIKSRRDSSTSDFLVIIVTALAFSTGYLFTSGTLDFIPFFSNYLESIHILSAEIMMVMVAFLFCRTRLSTTRCTGCASCKLTCPTMSLTSMDKGNRRIFNYALYRCICCGACVSTCPEGAAELRHEISLKRFFQIAAQPEIQSVQLAACEKCGGFFAPQPQIDKLNSIISQDYIRVCSKCKQRENAHRLWVR